MRLTPQFALPPYSYVPGRNPHPVSHPAGHRFGGIEFRRASLEPNEWSASDAYGFAIDLFNEGYYWEAHEVWEGCWNAAGRRGTTADFLKGLIKLAAALVKGREGRVEGIRRHARRASELFRGVHASASGVAPENATTREEFRYAGLLLSDLLKMADRIEQQADTLLAIPKDQPSDLRLVTG